MGSSEANGLVFTLIAPANDDAFRLELLCVLGAAQRPGNKDNLAGSLGLDGWSHVCLRVNSVDEVVAELRQRDVRILLEPTNNAGLQVHVAFFADP